VKQSAIYADSLSESIKKLDGKTALAPIETSAKSTSSASTFSANQTKRKAKKQTVAELQLAYRREISLSAKEENGFGERILNLVKRGLPLNKALDIAPPLEADFPTDDDLECVAHPLSYAVRRGVGPDVIAILLDAGAATNCTYEYTKHEVDGTETVVTTSPLCLAVQLDFNNTERTVGVIKLLLAAGGQVGAVDSLGCSALYYAVAWGSASTVEVLLHHAAASSPSWLARMLNATQYITHGGGDEAPRPQILLLDVSEAESADAATRQSTAAAAANASDLMPFQYEKAKLLIKYGADSELKEAASGWSPMYAAAYQGKGKMVKAMLAAGCNQHNVTLASGWTAVFAAASAGSMEAVRALVQAGGSTVARDFKGRTAIHDACANGHYDVVKYLLAHGGSADTVADDKPTEHWSTPALMACSTADVETNYGGADSDKLSNMVEMLCRHGANVNRQVPETGATCLHYTASQGNLAATKMLVAFGADISGPKHQGRASALDLAVDYDREASAQFLSIAADWLKDADTCTQLHPGVYVRSSALLEIAAVVGCPSAILHHLENDAADPHLLAANQPTAAAAAAATRGSTALGYTSTKKRQLALQLPADLMDLLVGDGSMHSFPEEAMRKKREEITTTAGYIASMALLQRAAQPWSWTNHSLFHSGVRRVVKTVLLVSHRHWHSDVVPLGLPHMPVEIWHYILSFVKRCDHCSTQGPAAVEEGRANAFKAAALAARGVAVVDDDYELDTDDDDSIDDSIDDSEYAYGGDGGANNLFGGISDLEDSDSEEEDDF